MKSTQHVHQCEFRGTRAQTASAVIAEQLEDVYLWEEFMADICKPEAPCEMCLRHAARSQSAKEQ